MSPRTSPGLLLPLLLALAACGGDEPAAEYASVPAPESPAAGTAAAAPAPQEAAAEADARALSNYRLNEQDLQRWAEVMRSPEQRAAVEGEFDFDDAGTPQGVATLRTHVESTPEYRAVVERAGLTPTRFAIITNVVVAAASAHELGKGGMDADSVARASGIHPANVGFVAEHEAEIRPLLGM